MERLILHRGYNGKFPENSRIAFENALKEGYHFEIDIRVSKDGVCYLIHDETLDRLFNGTGKVSERRSSELSQYTYKDDPSQKLCTLNELCELIDSAPNKSSLIFIHVKDLKDVDTILSVLDNYNFKDRVRLFAVDGLTMPFLDYIKEHSNYLVGLHIPENSSYFDEQSFAKADFIWPDEITRKHITKELIEMAHKLEKPVYAISPELIPGSVFNKNIKRRWKEMIEDGVDGICTDMPTDFSNFEDTL